ncbi:MAG: chemoreceptor glutamine deamidase CheD [Methylococcales bacterium]|nr:chemoreceptor glutamine deamidase CheD [Methylococcales bacterium]
MLDKTSTTPIKKYWDGQNGIYAAKLLPGEVYVTDQEEMITTVLGSCIAVCVHDPEFNIGGMNHFMLPESMEERQETEILAESTRYGSYAMEFLINGLLKLGAKRERLQLKLFGGGKILPSLSDVGERNIGFIRRYVRQEGFSVQAWDLGGDYPRKVNFYPSTGRVRMKKFTQLHNNTLIERELNYRNRLQQQDAVAGSVELF